MKTNKFRVWDTNGMYNGTPGLLEDVANMDIGQEIWNNRNYIKMQFIGIKDHQGNEIYEGDIVKGFKQMYIPNWDGHDSSDDNCYVELDDEEIGIVVHQTRGLKSEFVIQSLHEGRHFTFHEISHIEVIGTVHQNPELLSGQAVSFIKERINVQ
ncbi:MAG TPA: YopX family protein [Bacillus sp. (in: firmicutes)]|nr:YopX family protein [Bacillus sp. (in: firmicutes)]